MPEQTAPEGAAKIHFTLNKVIIEGSTVFGAADLEPLYANLLGKRISAAEIYALTAKISAKYGADGYLVAHVGVVPQTVSATGAIIRLRVAEGYVERVVWPEEAQKFRDLWSPCVRSILAERPARTQTIERCLLRAGDLPGLTFRSSLKAGKKPDGGAVLVVTMTEQPLEAVLHLDNRGVEGQGPLQQTVSVTENNRLGIHESLNLRLVTSVPFDEMNFASLNWHQALDGDGLAFDLNASRSFSHPNTPVLRALDFNSQSQSLDAALSYAVIRSREQNLNVSAHAFAEDADSQASGAAFSEDKMRGLRLRLAYDTVDTVLGTPGQTQLITTVSQGLSGFGATANGNPLASVAAGRVDFTKLEASVSRTQELGQGFSLYGSVYGQTALSALLAAEQCTFGGENFGRGFDTQAFAGDICLMQAGELRFNPTIAGNPFSKTQAYLFIDHGTVLRLKPSASTVAQVDATSVGAGLRLGWSDHGDVDLQVARALSGQVSPGWSGFVSMTVTF